MLQGYSSQEYKQVYAKHGILYDDFIVRGIEGTEYQDLITTYPFTTKPLFAPYDSRLNLVSGLFISDPLNQVQCFTNSDSIKPYKEHAIVELNKYDFKNLPENHRRNIKKSEGSENFLVTEVVTTYFESYPSYEVYRIYQNLVKRHGISESGWTNYSREQIEQLIKAPGAVLFRTTQYEDDDDNGADVNYSLFYIDKNKAYYHLSCQTDLGYKMQSNFIMMHTALMFFKRLGLDEVLIGSVPDGSAGDGLWRFKKGFSTRTAWNYIQKHIYNQEVYDILSKGKESNGMFPAYR